MASQSIIIIISLSIIYISLSSSMAETQSSVVTKSVPAARETAAVHIVYTDRPIDEDLEIFHLRTLSSVLGRQWGSPCTQPVLAKLRLNFLTLSHHHQYYPLQPRPTWITGQSSCRFAGNFIRDDDAHVVVLMNCRVGKNIEEAAKGALLYTYKHAACGFSAKLTPKQVEELSKRPGVLQVMESRTVQLHD